MAAGIPARLTKWEGRRFGLTVGTAFLVLAGIVGWRGHATAAMAMGSIGGLLALAGLLIPTRLGPVERAWMKLAHAISRVTTPIVMGITYYMVLTPTAYLRRGLGRNPLVHAPGPTGFWQERPANARRSASMERQF
jgi:saxitoxin biosynthesis operon SxtJ-like protein